MQFGIYAPIPMATVGSPLIAQAIDEALKPLPDGRLDVQLDHSAELLLAADAGGFDLALFAERHLGHDLSAWVLASAIGSRFQRMLSLVAVHPGLWHPQLIAKMTTSLDRMSGGRAAINLVTGWNVTEARMYGGDVMLEDDERYVRAGFFDLDE